MYVKSVSSAEAEHVLVEGVLRRLDADTLSRWDSCKSSHRFLSFVNKKLIVYELIGGCRVIVDTLKCQDVSMTNSEGFTSEWFSESTETVHTVSNTPLEIHPSIFLWHTFHSDIRYQPHKGVYNIRFSMLYRSRHNPSIRQAGVLYILEQALYNPDGVPYGKTV